MLSDPHPPGRATHDAGHVGDFQAADDPQQDDLRL